MTAEAQVRHLFFDTSALVKYFHEEAGSARVTSLIEDGDSTVWISGLARVEFTSAMHRKFREGALGEESLKEALSGFGETVQAFRVEPLSRSVTERAETLLRKHGRMRALRTLDSLHLATYLLLADTDWRFVVADDRLHAVARREECALIHPVRERR